MKAAVLFCVMLLAAAAAPAATMGCSVTGVTLAFGGYTGLKAAPTDSIGNVAVTCSGPSGQSVAYSIALSAGGGSFPVRRMMSGSGSVLNYNLYTNAARTLVWGDGSSGTLVVSDVRTLGGASSIVNYPVYGRVFAGQKSPVGSYTDAIVVTLTF